MKFVVVGGGEVGYHIAEVMSGKNQVYVIDNQPDRISRIKDLDVQAVLGNGANSTVLKEVLPADVFVAVTNVDEINMIACFCAKKIAGNHIKTIARISNPDYIDTPVSSSPDLGVDVMVCPELSLASEIIRLLHFQGAIDSETFADGRVDMVEFIISEDNAFIGKKFKNLPFSDFCIVSGILRHNEILIPTGDDYLAPGDHVFILGPSTDREIIQKFFGVNKSPLDKNKKRNIMLFGCGTIGLYLAKVLDKDGSVNLKIIEKNHDRCLEVIDMIPNSLLLNGDATDVDLFKEENVKDMDVVIALTDSDEKNLLCGLMSKHMGAKKIIARTRHPNYIPVFEMVGVDVALSTQRATINEVLRLTAGKAVTKLRTIGDQKAEVFEFITKKDSNIVGRPLKDIYFPNESIIGMIVRENEPIVPNGNTVILPNDLVIVFAKPSAYKGVTRLFQ